MKLNDELIAIRDRAAELERGIAELETALELACQKIAAWSCNVKFGLPEYWKNKARKEAEREASAPTVFEIREQFRRIPGVAAVTAWSCGNYTVRVYMKEWNDVTEKAIYALERTLIQDGVEIDVQVQVQAREELANEPPDCPAGERTG